MAGLTPKAHTQAVLSRMQLAGSVPGNIERDNDARADNYGLASARSSDASSFKTDGAPKSPHMGRPGRQAGGRITGQLIRTRRTPEETAKDIANEDSVIDSLAKDREGRAHGGRTKGKTTVNVIIGGQKAMTPPSAPPMPPPMAAPGPVGPPRPPPGPPPGMPPGGMPVGGAPLGAAGAPPPGVPPMLRARGGRVGRQMGGAVAPVQQNPQVQQALQQRAAQQAAARQALAHRAATQGPVGALPGQILRAKGGRIEIDTPGVHDYGKAGVPHGEVEEKYGAGSGLGRMAIARRQK